MLAGRPPLCNTGNDNPGLVSQGPSPRDGSRPKGMDGRVRGWRDLVALLTLEALPKHTARSTSGTLTAPRSGKPASRRGMGASRSLAKKVRAGAGAWTHRPHPPSRSVEGRGGSRASLGPGDAGRVEAHWLGCRRPCCFGFLSRMTARRWPLQAGNSAWRTHLHHRGQVVTGPSTPGFTPQLSRPGPPSTAEMPRFVPCCEVKVSKVLVSGGFGRQETPRDPRKPQETPMVSIRGRRPSASFSLPA